VNTTAAIVSGAIALLALVISIFGAAWLNQRATEKLIDQMAARFEARFEAIEARFAAVEQRLDRIERQLEAIFKPIIPRTPQIPC
jgi:uncharacterized membrane protein YfbV (UPF0208 family)